MNHLKSPNSKNRKNVADAKKDPTSCLLTPGRWWQRESHMLSHSFQSAGYDSSEKPFQPGAHRSLSWPPGTLHESLLHSTYHRLPCFIVIYVCVCLPKETVGFQKRGQGLRALCLSSPVSDRMLDSYTFAELTSQPPMSGGIHLGGQKGLIGTYCYGFVTHN